jgi:hypothetical protein
MVESFEFNDFILRSTIFIILESSDVGPGFFHNRILFSLSNLSIRLTIGTNGLITCSLITMPGRDDP